MGSRAGIALQNALEDRQDVLVYTAPPLEQDIEVTGPITAVLFVSTNAPHADFTAKLVDVYPNGNAYNVTDGILRQPYQRLTLPAEIRIDLWPTSRVFFKGHRLRLEVSSSNYPRFDRNPNTGRGIATETEPVIANQAVYHGTTTQSCLILPLIPDDHGGKT